MCRLNMLPAAEVDSWGSEEIKQLCDCYCKPQTHEYEGQTYVSEAYIDVSEAKALHEWVRCKNLVRARNYWSHQHLTSILWEQIKGIDQLMDSHILLSWPAWHLSIQFTQVTVKDILVYKTPLLPDGGIY